MSYEVIARKWRPQTFEEVVGQDHVVRTLRSAIESGRIAQAYLLAGPRGTGKTTLARIFEKALNCVHGPTTTPCGVCPACKAITSGSSFDVVEIDGASNNKVEDIHGTILDTVQNAPVEGKFRIFYIDEVHMLSQGAFNALLKTLEEPPPYLKFIFATTDPEKVLGTILSRCQRFDLRKISVSDICGQLRKICAAEDVSISDDALLAIARGADGGMRDAESALDQIIAFTGKKISEDDVIGVFGLVSRSMIEDLADAILREDVARVLARLDELDRSGKNLRRLVGELIDHFRNLLVCLELGGKTDGLDITEAQRDTLLRQKEGASPSAILSVVEELVRLEGTLRLAISQRTLVETSLIRCTRFSRQVDLERILRRLAALERGLAAPATEGAAPQVRNAAPPVRVEAAPPVRVEAAPQVRAEAAPPVRAEAAPQVRVEAAPPVRVEAAPPVPTGAEPQAGGGAEPQGRVADSPEVQSVLSVFPGARITDVR